MTHVEPQGNPDDLGRRKSPRFRTGPLRVRLHRTCEGILVDLSETGALVQLPIAPAPQKEVTLQVEWDDTTLQLRARVIHSSPQALHLPSATLVRPTFHVAVEFSAVEPDTATMVRRILQNTQSH